MRAPRWWHRLRAEIGGYFWLPCPLCGKEFGGHEWTHGAGIHSIPLGSSYHSQGICPRCAKERRSEVIERWIAVDRGFEYLRTATFL